MQTMLAGYVADVPTAIAYGLLLIGLVILLIVALWPLDHGPDADPMADAFGDWPNIDPRL